MTTRPWTRASEENIEIFEADLHSPMVQRHEVVLEDVVFTYARGGALVARGTRIYPMPDFLESTGWFPVDDDASVEGAPICSAAYIASVPEGVYAMGPIWTPCPSPGATTEALRRPEAPVEGPSRGITIGKLGGTNFLAPTRTNWERSLRKTLSSRPGSLVLVGTDDWFAPDSLRPEVFVPAAGVTPAAWWHDGRSGKSVTGAVLTESQMRKIRKSYRSLYGESMDVIVNPPWSDQETTCGCWRLRPMKVYSMNYFEMVDGARANKRGDIQ